MTGKNDTILIFSQESGIRALFPGMNGAQTDYRSAQEIFNPIQNVHAITAVIINKYPGDRLELESGIDFLHQKMPYSPIIVIGSPEHDVSEKKPGIIHFIDSELVTEKAFPQLFKNILLTTETVNKFQIVFDGSPDVIFIIDAQNRRILASNAVVKSVLGYGPEEVTGRDYIEFLPKFNLNGSNTDDYSVFYGGVIETPGMIRKDGTLCPMDITWNIVNWQGVMAIFATMRNITERKNSEKTISFMAYHDPLTGLPNRARLWEYIEAIIRKPVNTLIGFTILFMDVDRFKTINDTLGHNRGDDLLKQIAVRLKMVVRSEDIVSRIGGDEFVIVLSGVSTDKNARYVAEKVLKSMSRPFRIADRDIYITTSIGISFYPHDANETSNILRNADLAMYLAKDLGRNNYQFYTDELNLRARIRLDAENDLRKAIEKNEFFLVYQPVVDPDTNRIISVEALIRWNHPEHGVRSPSIFIPLAEEIGLIDRLGSWSLYEACRQNMKWRGQGLPPISVAVNVSGRHFRETQFVDTVFEILKETGLNPRDLEIELTESILLDESEENIGKMKRLHDAGITISIDDFGTGYSSLSYLKRFPIDVLKIDRTFVNEIGNGPDGESIVKAIVSLADSLGLKIIAEGIETANQLEFLSGLKCKRIQGFFFYRPVSADEIAELLALPGVKESTT